jgi:hypothetical protein
MAIVSGILTTPDLITQIIGMIVSFVLIFGVASLLAIFTSGELVAAKTAHFHLACRSRYVCRVHFHAAGDSSFDSMKPWPNTY